MKKTKSNANIFKAVALLLFLFCFAFVVTSEAEETLSVEDSSCVDQSVKLDGSEVIAVGDSILLSVKPMLEFAIPGIYVDAKKSRQFKAGYQILKNLSENKFIRPYIIVELGSNGAINKVELEDLIKDLLAKNSFIILIKPYVPDEWQIYNSNLLYAMREKYKTGTLLVDWELISKKYDNDVLRPDMVHLNSYGQHIYTTAIIDALFCAKFKSLGCNAKAKTLGCE